MNDAESRSNLTHCAYEKALSRSIPLDFVAKASIAVCVDGLLLVAAPPGLGAPGSWWCKHRDRRGADLESEAMAKHTSKQAKTKPEPKVDTGTTKKAVANSEHEPQRGNRRALSQSGAARTDRAAANAAAVPKASLNGSQVVHDEPEPARSGSKPGTEQVDLKAPSASGAEQPPASTKRAQLIGLLERPEGATVAQIGQRLGWLPHTVRAAITGLRKAGREVTRSKDVDDRSVYRLARIETAGAR